MYLPKKQLDTVYNSRLSDYFKKLKYYLSTYSTFLLMAYEQITKNIETAMIKLGSQDKFQLFEKFGTNDCNICLSDDHNMVGVF